MTDPSPEELAADRLVHAMLEEATGQVEPPDLAARIERELARRQVRPAQAERPHRAPPRRWGLGLTAAAAAAALTIAALWLGTSDRTTALLSVRLLRGTMTFTSSTGPQTLGPGQETVIHAAVGDRIESSQAGLLHLDGVGILQLAHHTTLEIQNMNWTKRDGLLVVSSITIGAVVGAFTWNAFGSSAHADSGDSLTLPVGDNRSDRASRTRDAKALQDRVAELERTNEELRIALKRREIEAPKEKEEAPPAKTEIAELTATFQDPEFKEALGAIDWKVMGESMSAMVPMLAEIAAFENDKDIPPELIAKLTRVNQTLVEQALKMMDKVPGSGMNGPFSHPLIAANAMDAALKSAGVGLSDDQKATLDKCMRFHAAKDKSLRQAAENHELRLQTLVEELDYKEQFFDEARRILTPEQSAKLYHENTKGRASLDLFGTGVSMAEFAKPVPAANASEFANRLSGSIGGRANLPAETRQKLNRIVTEWANALPKETWSKGTGKGMRTERVRNAAKNQLALMQRIFREIDLPAEQRAAIARSRNIMVPMGR